MGEDRGGGRTGSVPRRTCGDGKERRMCESTCGGGGLKVGAIVVG